MIVIKLLSKEHDRDAFACGEASLDRFLHETAYQALRKQLSITYVALESADASNILGYYSLAGYRLDAGELPDPVRRGLKLPGHALPATLIGRMAVAVQAQGRGVGGLLLMDALIRCVRAADQVASVAVAVDAFDEAVVPFYARYGFERFEEGSLKMFLPMATARKIPELC